MKNNNKTSLSFLEDHKKISNRERVYEIRDRQLSPETEVVSKQSKGSNKIHYDNQTIQLVEMRQSAKIILVYNNEEAMNISQKKKGLRSMKVKTSVLNALMKLSQDVAIQKGVKYLDRSPSKRKGHVQRLSIKKQEKSIRDVRTLEQEVQEVMKGLNPIIIRLGSLLLTFETYRASLNRRRQCKKSPVEIHNGTVNILVNNNMKMLALLNHQVELLKKNSN